MHNQPLQISELISKVTEKLKEAQYSVQRLNLFIPTWNQLQNYMKQQDQAILDAKMGLDFLEEAYDIKP